MAFSIDYGSSGLLGGIVALCGVVVLLIILFWLFSAARQARRQVIEDEGDDKDLIA